MGIKQLEWVGRAGVGGTYGVGHCGSGSASNCNKFNMLCSCQTPVPCLPQTSVVSPASFWILGTVLSGIFTRYNG